MKKYKVNKIVDNYDHFVNETIDFANVVNSVASNDWKIDRFTAICNEMNKVYQDKYQNYDDNFVKTYNKLGTISVIGAIINKCNKLKNLIIKKEQNTNENIKNILLDITNYCIMTLIEMEDKSNKK